MPILYTTTSIADALSYDSAQAAIDTTAARLAPYVPEGIGIGYDNSSGGADIPDIIFPLPNLSEGWVSFYIDITDFSTSCWGHYVFALRNSSISKPAFAIQKVLNSASVRAYRSEAATFTYASPTYPTPGLVRFDIYFKLNSTAGNVDVYIDGASWYSYAGPISLEGDVPINSITFQREGGDSSKTRTVSALIYADEDTRTLHLGMDYPTGAGNYTAWDGVYTDVNSTGLGTGAAGIQTSTDGAKESFTFPALPAGLSAMTPKAVILNTSGSGIGMQVNCFSRISATDYDNGVTAVGATFARGINAVIAQNPATVLDWTVAEIEAAEFGFEAIKL